MLHGVQTAMMGINSMEVPRIQTTILTRWLSRHIERLDQDERALGVSRSFIPRWVTRFAAAAGAGGAGAQSADSGISLPRERKCASNVDDETSSGFRSAQKT